MGTNYGTEWPKNMKVQLYGIPTIKFREDKKNGQLSIWKKLNRVVINERL